MWLELVLAISDEYSASFRWVIFRKSKSRLYYHKLGKGEKVIHYTHTQGTYQYMGGQGDCPIFLSRRTESLLPQSEILTYTCRAHVNDLHTLSY